MLPRLPSNSFHSYKYPLFHRHLTPSHTRIHRLERAPPPNGTPPTSTLNTRNRSIVDTTPVLAKSTAGVELAGGAEKATAAEPEALEPGACVEAAREVKKLLREGKHVHEPGHRDKGAQVCVEGRSLGT